MGTDVFVSCLGTFSGLSTCIFMLNSLGKSSFLDKFVYIAAINNLARRYCVSLWLALFPLIKDHHYFDPSFVPLTWVWKSLFQRLIAHWDVSLLRLHAFMCKDLSWLEGSCLGLLHAFHFASEACWLQTNLGDGSSSQSLLPTLCSWVKDSCVLFCWECNMVWWSNRL